MSVVDDVSTGLKLRAIRIRARLTQLDLSRRAGVSRQLVSLVEHGHLDRVSLRKLRAIAGALQARVDVGVRWRGPDLDRMLNAGHAGMHDQMAALLTEITGWQFAQEVSYAVFGERGVIDILAWHPGRKVLLIIELKTQLVDVNDLLGQMDRRRRLALRIAAERGWGPGDVATWVVLRDTRTNRRRVAAHAATLRHAFPVDGRSVRRWLRDPVGPMGALSFLTDDAVGGARRGGRSVERVRRRRSEPQPPDSPATDVRQPRIGVTFGD